ncbi:MAG: HD domain-containing protein [Deltaproteobacteria bacterium]|nr:HD domain-containing protein [Deltaproteobacteria bacterium]
MVRFSDIIGIRGKSLDKEGTSEGPAQDDKLWLSDSQMLKVRTEKGLPDVGVEERPNIETVAYYEKFLERAMEIRERVKKDQGISPSPILSDLHYLIEKDLLDAMYDYAVSAPDDYEEMMVHTVDVTFASLKIGKGLDYDTRRLLQLGLAAFLENVGMYKIPENILNKKGRLEDFELAVIKNHPEVSAQILSRMGKKYQWLADVALQVHERADGSGYPRGLKGQDISELAAVIGLIDTYIAMIKKRPYREKFVQADAIKFIIGETRGLFPSRILKVFLGQISLFPVGSLVKLNNKSVGRVLSTDKNQPLRPTLELLYDSLGNRVERGDVVRLAENPLLYIVGSVDDKTLGESP